MSWAEERTGIRVRTHPLVAGLAPEFIDSIRLGLRRNPLRAQLLVSSVLGKHVPVRASMCLAAGDALARAVRGVSPGPYDVIGFAETATGLGHQVAHGLDAAMYVHTTRRPGDHPRLGFLEEHSHAVDQAFTPLPGALDGDRVAVLVDDEISTGRTALNAIAALAPVTGHTSWVLASLLDTRTHTDREFCAKTAATLGVTLLDAALLGGAVSLANDSAPRAATAVLDVVAPVASDREPSTARVVEVDSGGRVLTARRSFTAADDAALRRLAVTAAAAIGPIGDAVVVGDEELMYFPQLLAAELGDLRVCTTTRSPAVAVDDPGYPLRTAVAFDSVSEPGRVAYSYNTATEATLLFVTEDRIDDRCRRGVLAALASGGAEVIVLVFT